MYPFGINLTKSLQVKFFAGLAMVGLLATLVAVGVTTGTTQAQNAGNTYDPPIPCGPGEGVGVAFQPEPHEITMGHYALFDSYWERKETAPA